jgi:hypothetical protein
MIRFAPSRRCLPAAHRVPMETTMSRPIASFSLARIAAAVLLGTSIAAAPLMAPAPALAQQAAD